MSNILKVIPLLSFLGIVLGVAVADDTQASEARTGDVSAIIAPWGVDLESMQKAINPGDDFYGFANGGWETSAEIEPGRWSAGAQISARERMDTLTDDLIEDVLAQRWPHGSDEAKFVTLYRAYTKRRSHTQRGVLPLRWFLDLISKTRSHTDIAQQLGNYQVNTGGLFKLSVRIDPEGKQAYVPSLEPAGLLLGRQLNYLRDDPHLIAQREMGADLLTDMLRHAGQRRNVNARVQAVLLLETEIAALYPSAEFLRDPSLDNVYMSIEDLQRVAPNFPWVTYFRGHGLGAAKRIHVRVWQNLEALTELFKRTPVSVWRDYMRLRLLSEYGPYLSDRIARKAEALDMLRRGVPFTRLKVSRRAGDLAVSLMPDVIGRTYFGQTDNQARSDEARVIAEAIREAFRARIMAADWPTPETKAKAIEKLDAIEFMIGRPPGWNDYSEYRPHRVNSFDNVYRARLFRREAALQRLRRPEDAVRAELDVLRSRVFFSPLQIGAYYLPRLNVVIIPAAYLQQPFYDPGADIAVNFGALGSTIGHELGHAFDDQGSKYGADGQLEDWWSTTDRARFDQLGADLSAQFATYDAVPGVKVNTALTLGENLSDLVGLEIAYQAYEALLDQQGADVLEKKEGMQRFFLGYAQKRKAIRRPNVALELALEGAHSPPVHRVNGIVRNMDGWYEAFDVQEGDALWLAPEKRVKVW